MGGLLLSLTGLVVDQKVLLRLFILDPEEVERLLKDLAELHLFAEGELTRDASLVGTLRTMDNDFLGRWHVGRQEDGGVHLLLPQDLLQVLELKSN